MEKENDRGKSFLFRTVWTVIGALITAAVLAGVGFTWSTYTTTHEMKMDLSKLCAAVPELKLKHETLELKVQKQEVADVEMRGRLYFLEKSLELFESRLNRVRQ